MAAGEYISMQSQRELFERQIELERAEMEAMPEEEEAELAAAYRAKGFARDEAARIAHRLFQDPEAALDMLVREELGLDPDELGSPWGAAIGSMVSFAIGAAVPVIPFLFGGGPTITVISLGLSLAALFAVGAGVSLLTGRGLLFSGFRQLAIGLGAAIVTFLIGSIIGVGAGGLIRWATRRSCASGSSGEGLDPGAWSNGPGDTLRLARPRLRQGHRRRVGLDHVRARRSARWSSRPATDSSCRRVPRTTRSSDRTASCAWRRTCRPAR